MTVIDPKPINHGRDHLPEGPDPIPGLPSPVGNDVDDIIMSYGPDAFWKLNEPSGTIAHDSSGNGYDLQPGGSQVAPTFGADEAPPGETSADFGPGDDNSDGFQDYVSASQSAFTNNFTAGIWANVTSTVTNNELMGQGAAGHSSNGWGLVIFSGKPWVIIATDDIRANNTISADTWYFVACVRDAGTFKLYVNGLLQADTMTTSFTGQAQAFIGNDNFTPGANHNQCEGMLAYAFIIDDVLTGAQLLEIYETGSLGGAVASGKVWTSNGAGGASWQYPTIEVEY